jgi:methyl-accepting chemotaxis protein
MQRADMAAD